MKKSLVLGFVLLFFSAAFAQDIEYDTRSYSPNIRTVQLYKGQNQQFPPILFLGANERLNLEFDELVVDPGTPFSDFWVDIVSCNANWEKSNVLPIEFYKGFTQKRILDFMYSEQTKTNYIHYGYSFPQDDEQFTMSGNYLLKVYKLVDGEQEVALTYRFIVVERQVDMQVLAMLNDQIVRQSVADIRFRVLPSSSLPLINPSNDLKIAVLENFRWDNGVYGLQPTFFRRDQLDYFLDLKRGFGSSPEFRFLDIRSARLYGNNVADITELDEYYVVTRQPETARQTSIQTGQLDRNGQYFLERMDWPNAAYQADYMKVNFRLDAKKNPKNKVYVIGAMSHWRPDPEFEMTYNDKTGFYEASIMMKQGVYDFAYATQDAKTGLLETGTMDGQTSLSENYYTALVYFRAPADRNDRIIGYMQFNY
ncbi:MAG: type IX secretion system plug protein domain-containing protein [Bacteroidia bacterium]